MSDDEIMYSKGGVIPGHGSVRIRLLDGECVRRPDGQCIRKDETHASLCRSRNRD